MYTATADDCNKYIKSLAYSIEKKGDYANVNDELNIPVANATDYINKATYLLGATNLDFAETVKILNHGVTEDNNISESELRIVHNNAHKISDIVERNENELNEKNNTIDTETNSDKESMSIIDPVHEHNESHDNRDNRQYSKQKFRNTQFVRKNRDQLLGTPETGDPYKMPQFVTRRELLKWILDRISYLQHQKVDDFMLFFTSDEPELMKAPDELYQLMFNHLGKHAADIAMNRFRSLLPKLLPPDQGFYNEQMSYPPGMAMGGYMPSMQQPYGSPNGGRQQNSGFGQNMASDPKSYYMFKGVIPPFMDIRSPEAQNLIWEYEQKQTKKRERQEERDEMREDMNDRMQSQFGNMMDPRQMQMMFGGGGMNGGGMNGNGGDSSAYIQNMVMQGMLYPEEVMTPNGQKITRYVPATMLGQNRNGNGQGDGAVSVYSSMITTMNSMYDTIIKNLSKPNEYKEDLFNTVIKNVVGNMDPLSTLERSKQVMDKFAPQNAMGQGGGGVREVLETANFLLARDKQSMDFELTKREQDQADKKWQWEREREQRDEQNNKQNTLNLVKTFSEVLPNALGPMLQLATFFRGSKDSAAQAVPASPFAAAPGGMPGAAPGGLDLGGIMSQVGQMLGGGGAAAGGQDMSGVMEQVGQMFGGQIPGMGGGNIGGMNNSSPFGGASGGYNPATNASQYTHTPNPNPQGSPYYEQFVKRGPATRDNTAPPSDLWNADPFSVSDQGRGQQQFFAEEEGPPQHYERTVQTPEYREHYEETNSANESVQEYEYTPEDFADTPSEVLEKEFEKVQATKNNLVNAEQAMLNEIMKRKPTIVQQQPQVQQPPVQVNPFAQEPVQIPPVVEEETTTMTDNNNDGVADEVVTSKITKKLNEDAETGASNIF